MQKLSAKQIEVIKILHNEKTYIVYMKGLTPSCFIHCNLKYKISTSTLFALESLKIIQEVKSEWNSSEYKLTTLGVMQATGLQLCASPINVTIEIKNCADIAINPTDIIHTDKPYGLLTNSEIRNEIIANSTTTKRFKARERYKKIKKTEEEEPDNIRVSKDDIITFMNDVYGGTGWSDTSYRLCKFIGIDPTQGT